MSVSVAVSRGWGKSYNLSEIPPGHQGKWCQEGKGWVGGSPGKLTVIGDANTMVGLSSHFCFCGDDTAARTAVVEYKMGRGQTVWVSGEGEDTNVA